MKCVKRKIIYEPKILMEVLSFIIGFVSFQIGWAIGEYVGDGIISTFSNNRKKIMENLVNIENKLEKIEMKLDGMG